MGVEAKLVVRKRRRTKTYNTRMQIQNILRFAGITTGLQSFIPRRDEAGNYIDDPLTWAHLNITSDMGPDLVCAFHLLCYCLGVAINDDWDCSHSSHNGSRATLKAVGLWKHELCYISA